VEDKALLKLIKLLYSGKELEAALSAWQTFPTYKTDCPSERRLKEQLRKTRIMRILQGEKVNS
jgi:hypothetical protein